MMMNMKERKDSAVSPVVGVMLMLVVTIIIAGVVAAFAGGLVTTDKATPTLVASTEIWSGDSYNYYAYGRFAMTIDSVSEPINTADVKLVTSWKHGDVSGGNTTMAGMKNTKYDSYSYNSPLGYGSGVSGNQVTSGQYGTNQWFGNYTLVAGTSMAANGAGSLKVSTANKPGDGMDAVLGDNWSTNLEKGDVVSVKLIYLPTNAVIYDAEVIVK